MAYKRAFEQPEGKNDEWLTPKWIVDALGTFKLDPCAVHEGPWLLAENNFTIFDDGLNKDWNGWRTWMNPPFNRWIIGAWYEKMTQNNNGISLQIGKTEVNWFRDYVKPVATSMLMMDKRFVFLDRNGEEPRDKDGKKIGNCGGSPILVAYGEMNADALEDSGISGLHVPIQKRVAIIVNLSGSWFDVVSIALRGRSEVDMQELYGYIQSIAPDKVARNNHWKEKIRQQVYRYQNKKQAA